MTRGSLGEVHLAGCGRRARAVFSDEVNIAIGRHSLETFEGSEAELDQQIDLRQVGYLFLLDNDDHVDLFTKNAELQNALGVDTRMISVEEARRLSPLIDTTGLQAALWSPRAGHCTPEAAVQGYARAARRAGVTIVTGTPATGLVMDGDTIQGVQTHGGTIGTSSVLCAAGDWAKEVGGWAGVDLPVEPLRRQSDDSWGFDTSRDTGWLPALAEAMERRAPSLIDVGIQSGWAGLYEMTPDHNALVGRSRTVPGFSYACGFSGHGFLMGPAVGEVMQELVLDRTPFIDVSALDVERFARADARPELTII